MEREIIERVEGRRNWALDWFSVGNLVSKEEAEADQKAQLQQETNCSQGLMLCASLSPPPPTFHPRTH